MIFNGSNASGFKGAIYSPQADISFAGGAGTSSNCTRLFAASIILTGGSTATFSNNGCPATAGPVLTSSGASTDTSYTRSPMLIQ